MSKTTVVVGASIGGFYTVNELVKRKYPHKIILIDQKDTMPYNTYPLSKEWMLDLEDFNPPLLKKADFYSNNVELRLNTKVLSFDEVNKIVKTDKGDIIYDNLVLAMGSKLRHLSVENDDAVGIFYLREFNDALNIKKYLKDVSDIVIIGAGFISLELASTFKTLNKNVSIMMRGSDPLIKILGGYPSAYIKNMHINHGVKFLENSEVFKFIKDENNKLVGLIDKNNNEIKTDMIIIGVGVDYNLSVANLNLKVNRGIVVNEYNETKLKDVYALGDIVEFPYEDNLIHLEHWESAYNQGLSTAKNIIENKSSKLSFLPYFWSDQYDQTFEYLGYIKQINNMYVREDSEDKTKFSVVYTDENNIAKAMLFSNKMYKRSTVSKFLANKKPIDKEKFSDISIDLLDI